MYTETQELWEEAEAYSLWETPIPFDHLDIPDFPLEVLPPAIRDFTMALSVNTQTPTEMSGLLVLGVLATAAQRLYEVEIKPGWKEPLGLYTVAIAPPGERKSAVISALTAPLIDFERVVCQQEMAAIEGNKSIHNALQMKLKQVEREAAKGNASFEEVQEAAKELNDCKRIQPYRLVSDDTTPEKLESLMESQDGKLCICSAEGGVFDAMAGRYDKALNIDVYLKAHAGDFIRTERVNRPAVFIPSPSLSMILTVQPHVLQGLLNNDTFRGRGLCGRFLYAVCRSKVGYREIDPPSITKAVRLGYDTLVLKLLSRKEGGKIRLSPEAYAMYITLADYLERRMREGYPYESMRDWGSKNTGTLMRIAAILHVAERDEPCKEAISADTLDRAWKIFGCLSLHAMSAYQQMGADGIMADAEYLWRRILAMEKQTLNKRILFILCRNRFKTVEKMDAPLAKLVEMNYIRIESVADGKRGRRSVNIIVNPLAQKAQ